MIAKCIENNVTNASWKKILLRQKDFTWVDLVTNELRFDGPTMLWIIFNTIKPSTTIGLENYKLKIEKARMNRYNHNVVDMLDEIEEAYNTIVRQGGSHDDYMQHILDALLSTKNEEFRSYILRKKDDFDEGKTIDAESLLAGARKNFVNMQESGAWDCKDPRDQAIASLMTKLQSYQKSGRNPPPKLGGKRDDKKKMPPMEFLLKEVVVFTSGRCKRKVAQLRKTERRGIGAQSIRRNACTMAFTCHTMRQVTMHGWN